MTHSCTSCSHDCGCAITEHTGSCVHHVHKWSYDYYYDDNPRDELVYCWGCRKKKSQIRREENEQRELARAIENKLRYQCDKERYE